MKTMTLPTSAAPPLPSHFSFSGMKTFGDCAKRWRFRYLLNAPEERVAAALLYGGAIHAAVEHWHLTRLCDQPPPSNDKLLRTFKRYFVEETKGRPIHYAKTETEEGCFQSAAGVLDAFAKHELTQPKERILAVEEPVRIETPELPVPIEGRLDLLVETADKLILRDYKTSKGTFTADKEQDAAAQMSLYAASFRTLAEELGKPLEAEVVVLRKLKTPKVEVAAVSIAPEGSERIMRRLIETWRLVEGAYRQNAFPPTPSWRCVSCPYRERCAQE